MSKTTANVPFPKPGKDFLVGLNNWAYATGAGWQAERSQPRTVESPLDHFHHIQTIDGYRRTGPLG